MIRELTAVLVAGLFTTVISGCTSYLAWAKYNDDESTIVTKTTQTDADKTTTQDAKTDSKPAYKSNLSVEVDSLLTSNLSNLVNYLDNVEVYSENVDECCQILDSTLTAYKSKSTKNFTYQILKLNNSVKVFISESDAASPLYQDTYTYNFKDTPQDFKEKLELPEHINAYSITPNIPLEVSNRNTVN